MGEETKPSTAGVIPADTATGQEAEVVEQTPPVETKVDEKPNTTEEQNPVTEEPTKLKATLDKVRDERDAAEAARKETEKKIKQLEQELKVRDEREAEAQGNYKKLWEDKAAELLNVATEKKLLEEKLDTVSSSSKNTLNSLSTALNTMIDANMKNWPDKAKNFVDNAEAVSADIRLAQYLKAYDLVSDFLKEAPNPGLTPSPKDIREEGREKQDNLVEKANSLKASGIYRV